MNKHLLTQRQYESDLKDLIEEIVCWLEDPHYKLYDLYMPRRTVEDKPLTVLEWLQKREQKRSKRGQK